MCKFERRARDAVRPWGRKCHQRLTIFFSFHSFLFTPFPVYSSLLNQCSTVHSGNDAKSVKSLLGLNDVAGDVGLSCQQVPINVIGVAAAVQQQCKSTPVCCTGSHAWVRSPISEVDCSTFPSFVLLLILLLSFPSLCFIESSSETAWFKPRARKYLLPIAKPRLIIRRMTWVLTCLLPTFFYIVLSSSQSSIRKLSSTSQLLVERVRTLVTFSSFRR